MNSPGSGSDLTAVRSSSRNKVLIAGVKGNALPINNQRVASLHDNHVFVAIMHVRSRWRSLTARPKRHLAPVSTIEDVAFNSWSRLVCGGDPVRWMPHELGKLVHGRLLSQTRLPSRLTRAVPFQCDRPGTPNPRIDDFSSKRMPNSGRLSGVTFLDRADPGQHITPQTSRVRGRHVVVEPGETS